MRSLSFKIILLILASLIIPIISHAQDPNAEITSVSRSAEAEELNTKAMSILQERLDEKSLSEAISCLEQAAKLDPSREEIWIKLSWHYWLLGDEIPKKTRLDRKRRLELNKRGMSAGERAIEINPKSVGGLFWFTVNMAAMGEMKGILSSLRMGGTLLGNMNRVDRRDPYYLHGGTRRFGSEVFVNIPRWIVKKFGFKPEYIEEDLIESIQRWPEYFDNYINLAKVYWWNGNKDKALEQLEYVLTHSPDSMPEEKAENIRQQKIARRMWKGYTGREFPER